MKTRKGIVVALAGALVLVAVIPMSRAGGGPRCGTCELDGPIQLTTGVDRPVLLRNGGEQEVVVKIDLRAAPQVKGARSPLNVAVVLDRSGSMAGKKLEQAKQAAAMLVDQLDDRDVFSLVAYESDVEVLVPATKVSDRRALHRAIEGIRSGGSTALYDGVKSGARQLEEYLSEKRINRVLLLSDGIANVGPSSNREIANLGRRISQDGIAVTTIGLGEDYNEDLLAALAEASDANYYYVQDVEKLGDVFAKELGELQSVVARRVIVKVMVPKGVKAIGFLGRSESFSGGESVVEFSQLAGAQERYVLLRCLVDPSVTPGLEKVAEVRLEYRNSTVEGDPLEVRESVVGVEWSEDADYAVTSIDKEIEVEAEIMRNALETDRIITMADEGDYAAAKRVVSGQIEALGALLQSAPAAQQVRLREEIAVLEENNSELSESGLSKAGRKALQYNSYKEKNSK